MTCILGSHLNERGYARVSSGEQGRHLYAHRAAWERTHGPIPEGMQIHHKCAVKACVNVDHLELVSIHDHPKLHRKCDHDDRRPTREGTSYCRICKNEKRNLRRMRNRDVASC